MNGNLAHLSLWLAIVVLALLDNQCVLAQTIRIKRQIFREQVLPHAGGKIPAHAFNTDRLALNRLQKEGIAVPDGVLLEQRSNQVHPYLQRASRPTFSVQLTSDGRYTPTEGKYHHYNRPSIETTYLIPQIWRHALNLPPTLPILPVYRPLQLPNHLIVGATKSYVGDYSKDTGKLGKLIFDVPAQTVTQNWPPLATSYYGWSTPSRTVSSYQTFHQNDYVNSQFSKDFDDFFKSFNSRVIRNAKDGVDNEDGGDSTSSFVPKLTKSVD